jgi:hypothetical protein
MSDAEIRDALRFTRRWFELGIVDDAWIALAVREYRESDDQGDEHYRYGAFRHFLGQHPHLTPELCEVLFEVGAEDPDWTLGQSIMLDVLDRPECPASFRQRAATHSKTMKYWRDGAAG